jgi:hypothetical protein
MGRPGAISRRRASRRRRSSSTRRSRSSACRSRSATSHGASSRSDDGAAALHGRRRARRCARSRGRSRRATRGSCSSPAPRRVKVNGDWQYSYRMPSDSVFSRRIVNPALPRRAYDPDPIRFRVGSDATGRPGVHEPGPTDDAGSTPELEYTVRTTCAAAQGDHIFRRRAGVAARGEPRAGAREGREETLQFCLAMYERVIGEAETKARQRGAGRSRRRCRVDHGRDK